MDSGSTSGVDVYLGLILVIFHVLGFMDTAESSKSLNFYSSSIQSEVVLCCSLLHMYFTRLLISFFKYLISTALDLKNPCNVRAT
jgi:hypothetical protein